MTAIAKAYRFRCYQTDAATVDWTETVDIADIGPVGGQRVEAKDSTTSARPWTVTITDVAEDITARLAGSNGRAQLLRRLCDLSVATDGGVYEVLATGRIDAVEMAGVAAFAFTVTDERLIERTTEIFTAGNTARISPAGLMAPWLDYRAGATLRFTVVEVDAGNNTTTYLGGGGGADVSSEDTILRDEVLDIMRADVVGGPALYQSNFTNLRANIAGTDRTVVTFNGAGVSDPTGRLSDGDFIEGFQVAGYQDPGGSDTEREVYFSIAAQAASEAAPLHIGGQAGIDPFQLVKDIYDGTYQSASPATVRYDADALGTYNASTNPDGLIGRFPRMHFRITEPANMAEWLEREIYQPLGVVPTTNASGAVAPRLGRLPSVDQVDDPDTLFEFTQANSTLPHPGWLNQGRDQVTSLRVEFEYARPRNDDDTGPARDKLATMTRELERDHDNVATVRALHTIRTSGIHRSAAQFAFVEQTARSMFDLFGDGPIYTTVHGLSASKDVLEGDHVVLDLDSYPALQTQSRSGKRLARVLSKVIHPAHYEFELIELGPNSQPLATPSAVVLAANSGDDHNAIDVTIAGLGAGQGYELHLAAITSEPAESSDEWQFRVIRGTANETITVRRLPSGYTFWGRVRATAPGRISSAWSARDSQSTTAISAPTSLATSGVVGDQATVSWTLGETEYSVKVDLGGDTLALLFPGSTAYTFVGLTPSTSYTAGVLHSDPYGGESTRATIAINTTGTAGTLLMPLATEILVGGAV